MRNRTQGPVLAVLSVAVSLALLGAVSGGWLDHGAVLVVDNVGQLAAASTAALACVRRCSASTEGSTRRSWAMLALGAGCWAAGQVVWSVYEVVLGDEVPFPSLADVGFLLSPMAFGVGVLSWLRHGRTLMARMRDVFDGALTAGALLVLSWVTTLGAVYSASAEDPLAMVLGLAYPIADVVIGSLVLLALSRTAVAHRSAVLFVAAGLVSLAVADSAYVYLVSAGTYGSGNAVDAGWVFGFLLIAAGATVGPVASTGSPRAELEEARTGLYVPSRLGLVLPYLPVVGAAATIAVDLLHVRDIPVFELGMATALLVLILARQFLATTENRRLLAELSGVHEQLRHQALHDPLTGLANRSLFADRLQHALARRHDGDNHVAVLFCDVDNFKTVNDEGGHAAGDATLCMVADRIRDRLRPGDTVARLGGDEFAVLLEQTSQPMRVAEQLVDCVAGVGAAERAADGALVTLSVGVALSRPGARTFAASDEARRLLHRADNALYRAKAGGKNRAVLAREDDDTTGARRIPAPSMGRRWPLVTPG